MNLAIYMYYLNFFFPFSIKTNFLFLRDHNENKAFTGFHKNIPGMKPSIKISTCNCPNKEAYLLNGQCEIGEVVYEGTI